MAQRKRSRAFGRPRKVKLAARASHGVPHPGVVLQRKFIIPLGVTQSAFAKNIGISLHRLNRLIHGARGITLDTALRLERATGAPMDYWMAVQTKWEIADFRNKSTLKKKIVRLRPPRGAKIGPFTV